MITNLLKNKYNIDVLSIEKMTNRKYEYIKGYNGHFEGFETHISNVIGKLVVTSRTQAIIMLVKSGMINI